MGESPEGVGGGMVGGNTIHNTMGGTRYNTIHAPLYPCAVVGKTNFPSHYEECVALIGEDQTNVITGENT